MGPYDDGMVEFADATARRGGKLATSSLPFYIGKGCVFGPTQPP